MRKILYFVGAGLTKSLAVPTRPVPAMFDFVSTAAEYLYDDVILTTLAELENAEPYPYVWESPATRSLATMLVGHDTSRTPLLRSQFARALQHRPGESIEDLLDRTGTASGNMSSQSADVRFRYAIRRLVDLIGWDVDWSALELLLRYQFNAPNTCHTFVSFNYDLVLDRAIQRCLGDRMDFSTGYGFDISLQVTENPPKNVGGAVAYPPAFALAKLAPVEPSVLLLKPHGSLNWLVPETGVTGVTAILPLTNGGLLRYFSSTETFQRLQPPNALPIAVEPLILTPRVAKCPDRDFLREIREKEEEAIRSADEVFILGWSIPRTDSNQECLIRHNVAKRPAPFQKVTVVNLLSGVDYYIRAADIFGVARSDLRIFNSGFRDFVSRRSDV